MTSPLLLSIQVGQPRQYGREGAADPLDRPWTSSSFKEPVVGPVWLGKTNLAGDAQADLAHHGGPEKAVLAYAAAHYSHWRQRLDQPSLAPGALGENFTIDGLTEADVCIGDVWQVGEAVVQVTQPRQPCWKIGRRFRIKSLPLEVQQTGRTGWYLRVLKEGIVAAGMPLVLRERLNPDWTVARANAVMHAEKADVQAARELAALPELSASWQRTLARRAKNITSDSAPRLFGEHG